MGRLKKFDRVLKIRITFTQDAMLDQVSELTGMTKAQIVREMIDMDFGGRAVARHAAGLFGPDA